ncbi:universal stress protein [Deferrisoma palaeochoriense]
MALPILHVFRNNPRGFETFRGAAWFSRQTGIPLRVHFPATRHLVLYVGSAAVQVDLDESYVYAPELARARADALAREVGVAWEEQPATGRTGSTLPDIQGSYSVLSCPRALTSPFAKPLLPAVLGPKVRGLVQEADAPVFLPAGCWVPWDRVVALYGGSAFGLKALLWARALARLAGVPLEVLTEAEGSAVEEGRRRLEQADLQSEIEPVWRVVEGDFRRVIQEIPRTALVVFGAFGRKGVRKRVLGSRAHEVLRSVPYNLLMVGPRAQAPGAVLSGEA